MLGLLPKAPAAEARRATRSRSPPPVTAETKPWTRFWWMGSSVDAAGLRAALEAYREAGLGGVMLEMTAKEVIGVATFLKRSENAQVLFI